MAHPDLDRLLSFCIPFAQDQLKKRGEFYPFAANVLPDGQLNPIAIDDGSADKPVPSEMIGEFVTFFRGFASRGVLEAVAICYDGRVTLPGKEKQDAVTVFLEHSNGESTTIYIPYTKRKLLGYKFDQLVGVEADRRIFI